MSGVKALLDRQPAQKKPGLIQASLYYFGDLEVGRELCRYRRQAKHN